ncbi:helix-turn-helix domain-containing protein [Azospirillum tabaci]|uniref:helix-turn-helix domain-containing protein n=1 Tax=Azospirillum tabaci TaxID=2752310 RepID=UPI0016611CE9|nr:helix-turn-helix domain-containing protein [Azospirillum tabaci]
MSERSIKEDICGGQPYAIVPADALEDKSLSRDARWLFAVLCRHADPDGHCRRSMTKLGAQEGTSTRSLQRWLSELEVAGLVMKLNERGKVGAFRVVRDPAERSAAQRQNQATVTARREEFGAYGRKGAQCRYTRDRAVTSPLTPLSPSRDVAVASPVTATSPPRDTAAASPRDRAVGQNKTPVNKTPEEAPPPPPKARRGYGEAKAERERKRLEREQKRAERGMWSLYR